MRIRAEIFHATIVYHTVSRFDIISHVKEIGKRVVLFKHLLRENKVALRFTFSHESTLKDFSYNIRHENANRAQKMTTFHISIERGRDN